MAITMYFLEQKVEEIFRQEWMRTEDWNGYYSFLLSKGFNPQAILSQLEDENEDDSTHKLTNRISDYVSALLRHHKQPEVI